MRRESGLQATPDSGLAENVSLPRRRAAVRRHQPQVARLVLFIVGGFGDLHDDEPPVRRQCRRADALHQPDVLVRDRPQGGVLRGGDGRREARAASRQCAFMRLLGSGTPLARADILQLPGLVGIEVLAEQLAAALQRRPVGIGADERAEVGTRGFEHGAEVELVGFAQSFARIADCPDRRPRARLRRPAGRSRSYTARGGAPPRSRAASRTSTHSSHGRQPARRARPCPSRSRRG